MLSANIGPACQLLVMSALFFHGVTFVLLFSRNAFDYSFKSTCLWFCLVCDQRKIRADYELPNLEEGVKTEVGKYISPFGLQDIPRFKIGRDAWWCDVGLGGSTSFSNDLSPNPEHVQ